MLLGHATSPLDTIISHVTRLQNLGVNSVVRNTCDTTDPFSKGVFFIKAGDEWFFFDAKTGGVNRTTQSFSSSQIHLPVEQVSAKALLDWRQDLKLAEEVVKPIREAFEKSLRVTHYGKWTAADDLCDCYELDDDDCDCDCSTPARFDQVIPQELDAAWLKVVKDARASIHGVLDGRHV